LNLESNPDQVDNYPGSRIEVDIHSESEISFPNRANA